MANSKRISKELSECMQKSPEGITVALVAEPDLTAWDITLAGPPNTVYAGGVYNITLKLPDEYPFKAPQVNFATRIYHPNITNDNVGSICLSILKSENWKPASRIIGVLEAIRQLLVEPQPDDPLETRIADEYKNNRPEFEKNAKAYVARYSKKGGDGVTGSGKK